MSYLLRVFGREDAGDKVDAWYKKALL